jgi:hypothetical protein
MFHQSRPEAQLTQQIPLSQDATLVVALAGTAMPFAHSAEDEAERWLRTLRLHGEVGSTLQALGVSEAPLVTDSEPPADAHLSTRPLGAEAVDAVTRRATELALARDADTIGTTELLFAVMDVYGDNFDRALYLRGTGREELAERLGAATAPREA